MDKIDKFFHTLEGELWQCCCTNTDNRRTTLRYSMEARQDKFMRNDLEINKPEYHTDVVLRVLNDLELFNWSRQPDDGNEERIYWQLIRDQDDNLYEGEWLNNKKDGRGVQIYPNGTRYDGWWKDGVNHGFG